jgi:hypothetical protein
MGAWAPVGGHRVRGLTVTARGWVVAWGLALFAVLSLIAAATALARSTPHLDIGSRGPLTDIWVGDQLGCQVQYAGDPTHEFYPPDAVPGDCGTFLSYNGTLYGPDFSHRRGTPSATPFSNGSNNYVSFTSAEPQTMTGSGTAASPYEETTKVTAGTITLTEVDSYVAGNSYYRTDIAVGVPPGLEVGSLRLYHGGNCYLQGSGEGFGDVEASTGAPACTANQNDSPPGQVEEFSPITPGSDHVETAFSDVWSDIAAQQPLPDTCACTRLGNNGEAISWNVGAAGGTFSLLSDFSAVGLLVGAPPAATTPAPPMLGKTFDVRLVSGVVLIRLPHGASSYAVGRAAPAGELSKGVGFVPLTTPRQLPVGTQFDARRGTVELVMASATPHKREAGTFSKGVFAVSQQRTRVHKGLTTLSLLEGAFPGGPTYASCSAGTTNHAVAVASKAGKLSPKVLNTLTAKDNHGSFATRGRYSSATVRGTHWRMGDRCDGTLTAVRRGIVDVFDFATRKTIVLHAGQSYLARARANQE